MKFPPPYPAPSDPPYDMTKRPGIFARLWAWWFT